MEIRSHILASNTLLNFVGQGLPLLAGLVALPLVIQGLGPDRFGLLSLAWVILGYFSVFDLGLGRATTKYVAEALGNGEEDQVPRIIWTTVTMQGLLGILGTLVFVAITPMIADQVLNISPEFRAEAISTFYLLALSVPLILISSSFSGVLEASQKFGLVNAVRIPSSFLSIVLPLLGLAMGYQLPGIVLLIVISRVLSLLALIAFALRTFPTMRKYSVQFSLLSQLLRFGGWITVSSLAGPILVYLDRFLIGSALSMATVAYYTAPFEVVTRLWIIPGSLVMTLFPAFSTLGMTHREDLQLVFVRSIKYLLLATGPLILILLFFSNTILLLWLGPEIAEQSSLTFQILLLGTLVGLLAPVSSALLQGLGRPEILAKLYAVEIPFNIVLVWVLVQSFGIEGAALSFALRASIETAILFFLSSKFLSLPRRFVVENGLGRVVSILGVLAALLWIASMMQGVPLQIGIVLVAMVSFVLATWAFAFDEKDKKILVSMTGRLSSIMPGGKG
ncbi:MAG TPA: flippase [Bacteroidota bacterium]|nr:flippase [Bacteroidota bacterium]